MSGVWLILPDHAIQAYYVNNYGFFEALIFR